MEFTSLEQWLWYLNIAGNVAMLVVLLGRKLAGAYRLLFLYFLADLLQSVLGWALPDAFQFRVFAATQPLKWILAFWFVLELYGSVLVSHPALAKFAQGTVGILLAVSAGISLANIFVGHPSSLEWDWVATAYYRFDRTVDSTVSLFLLLVSVFLLWFPVKVRRNVASYITGFFFYFVARGAALLVTDLRPQYHYQVSAATLGIAFACMTFWTVMLRPEGEVVVTVTGHRWNPAEAERLALQLDAANSRLEHLMRL